MIFDFLRNKKKRDQLDSTYHHIKKSLISDLRRIPYWKMLSDEIKYVSDMSSVTIGKDADKMPLPPSNLRYGYHNDNDEQYLISGREEAKRFDDLARKYGAEIKRGRLLDFGCSSGRILRHFTRYPNADLYGVDIEAPTIEWALSQLPQSLKFVPITTFPHLPFEDSYFDIVISNSVFTHIRDLAIMTLVELRRILRPGGIGLITICDDYSYQQYRNNPRLFLKGTYMHSIGIKHGDFHMEKIPGDFLVHAFGPCSAVFYRQSYLRHVWGRFFDICEIIPFCPNETFRSVVIMRKPAA